MKTINREATEKDMELFFLHDKDGFYLKEKFHPDVYPLEEGIEDAQMFTEAEAMEIINHNPDLDLCMQVVGEVFDINEYEIVEEV